MIERGQFGSLRIKMPDEDRVERLSTGKLVMLSTWGWRQPDAQFRRFGMLSEAEAAEAWALVEARKAAGPREIPEI